MLKQFKQVKDHPEPIGMMYTCVDSRLLTSRLLGYGVGDYFIVRNAGNMIPNAKLISHTAVSTEPGVMELGCVINDVKNIIVCGHSDCKAINLLHDMYINDELDRLHHDSPLRQWLRRYGNASLESFKLMKNQGLDQPLEFPIGFTKSVKAYIDPDNKFSMADKLSQVNVLQQIHNIGSYPFMEPRMRDNRVKVHAMWFDIYTGDFYMFSQSEQRFVVITEESFDDLNKDTKLSLCQADGY